MSFVLCSITVGAVSVPGWAVAYDAMVDWQAVSGAASYRVYVRHMGGAYELAAEKAASNAKTDGSFSTVISSLPVESSTRFAVTSLSSDGLESAMSNEDSLDYAAVARVIDTDGDGLADSEEDTNLNGLVDAGETDPRLADTDGDGLSDYQEIVTYGTNPLSKDTDSDAATDGAEIAAKTDPRSAQSSPNVWVLGADPYASFSGAMQVSTAYAGGDDLDPTADSIGRRLVFANSTTNAMTTPSGADHVSYAVTLPSAGAWYLWGRFYFPGSPGSTDANSFWASVDGGTPLKFGNDRDYFQQWHWGGDGAYEFGIPVVLPLGTLSAGVHVLTIEKREVLPIPPRLDVMLLTPDANAIPNDAAAAAAVASQNVPSCSSDAACDDGNPCNGVERCDPGIGCIAGTPLVCDDGNACNGVETCDSASGCKVGKPLVCDDGNVCNGTETCDAKTGCKAGTPLTCGDGNACNGEETCDAKTGCKAGTPLMCDDGNVCNGVETCDAATGCKAGAPLQCDDGNACNGAETCDVISGCKAGPPLTCDDENVCNGLEMCDPAVGCKPGTALQCDDGVFCNGIETCNPGFGCVAGTPVKCELVTQQCEQSVCDEKRNACSVRPKTDGASCDDGIECTSDDMCVGGTCSGVNSCTGDTTCDIQSGICKVTADADNDGLVDAEDPCPQDARNRCFGSVAVDGKAGVPIRINAGQSRASCSGRRTDCNGDVWYDDFGYLKRLGATSCTLIGGCPLEGVQELFGCEDGSTDDVFKCDHSDTRPNRRLQYNFTVPTGVYLVNLYFANTQARTTAEGSTVFDINIENRDVFTAFDQVAAAGGSGKIVVRSALVEVLDTGGLDIVFQPRVGDVALKAIEVLSAR